MFMNLEAVEEAKEIVLFQEWCRMNNIKRFLLDADDTLWATQEIILRFMGECADYLNHETGRDATYWFGLIRSINRDLVKIYSVNPKRWNYVMERVTAEGGLTTQQRDTATNILSTIYQIPPRFLEGAEKGMEFLKKTGIPFGIVTHANVAWTDRK